MRGRHFRKLPGDGAPGCPSGLFEVDVAAKLGTMERRAKVYSSFEEEEKATREYYLSLTPQERLDILLELIEQSRDPNDEASQRFERVYRVTQLSQG